MQQPLVYHSLESLPAVFLAMSGVVMPCPSRPRPRPACCAHQPPKKVSEGVSGRASSQSPRTYTLRIYSATLSTSLTCQPILAIIFSATDIAFGALLPPSPAEFVGNRGGGALNSESVPLFDEASAGGVLLGALKGGGGGGSCRMGRGQGACS